MIQNLNLRDVERKAWRSFHQDGFLDIFFGLLMLSMAASAYLDTLNLPEVVRTAIYVTLEAVALGVLLLGRAFVTRPRLGQATFGQARRNKRLIVSLVLGGSVLIWLLTLAVGRPILSSSLMPLMWSAVCVIVFSAMAYFLDFERLYLVGFLYAVSLLVTESVRPLWGPQAAQWVFGGIGALITIMGLIILARFLRAHPVPDARLNHG